MHSALRQAVLVGNSGFLGRALESHIRQNRNPQVSLSVVDHRRLSKELLHSDDADLGVENLAEAELDQDWIFAAGLVDPSLDPAELEHINVDAPLRLLELLARGSQRKRRRLITFGSVLENRRDVVALNPYLRSKARLLDCWRQRDIQSPVSWLHIQLHTLYGGALPPHPFMFTGQMLSSLRARSCFRMSGGMQLREYHHVDDISASILGLLGPPVEGSVLIELSSGDGLRLRDLAHAVFDHFKALDLLRVGALPAADAEVFESAQHRSPHLLAYRDPIPNILAWFEDLGIG
jgi:nucleoside-diphosphate-sugar epimerase